jgi:hypothetical protein
MEHCLLQPLSANALSFSVNRHVVPMNQLTSARLFRIALTLANIYIIHSSAVLAVNRLTQARMTHQPAKSYFVVKKLQNSSRLAVPAHHFRSTTISSHNKVS